MKGHTVTTCEVNILSDYGLQAATSQLKTFPHQISGDRLMMLSVDGPIRMTFTEAAQACAEENANLAEYTQAANVHE